MEPIWNIKLPATPPLHQGKENVTGNTLSVHVQFTFQLDSYL